MTKQQFMALVQRIQAFRQALFQERQRQLQSRPQLTNEQKQLVDHYSLTAPSNSRKNKKLTIMSGPIVEEV